MAVTHPVTVRNTLAAAVGDSIDVGGAGSLIFQTAGDVEVATLTFSATAFGAPAAGVITAAAITDDATATGGITTKFIIENGAAAAAGFAGSVTISAGGGDIELTSTTIGVGDTVSMTSLTYTAPV